MRALLLAALALAACQTEPDDAAADMRRQHEGDTPAATGATAGADTLAVTTERVAYATVGGQAVTGVLARPESAEAGLPGVVVIQEWWGLNDNIEAMARRLADQGYVALAVDLYGGQVAATPDRAMALMRQAMTREAALEDNLTQAVRFLRDEIGSPRVGVIGWCFGGTWSLRTALAVPDQIDAAVVYYGSPVTDPARLGTLTMPVLAFFGEADTSIPRDTVSAFIDGLSAAGVEHTVQSYAGAPHGFANPSGQGYTPVAARDAWNRTAEFFARTLYAPAEGGASD